MRLFYAILSWKEAAQRDVDARVLVEDQAAALVLPVFSPGRETRGSAVWSTSVLAKKTNHYYILEDIDPAGKQGSSVPGADPASCVSPRPDQAPNRTSAASARLLAADLSSSAWES